MRYVHWMMSAALALGCSAVSADVYKWVDEKGTINYSNAEPPSRAGATRLDPSNPRLTVYKAVPPTAEEVARLEEYLRFRQTLAVAEQAARSAPAAADPYQGWYQQCVYEMWADCDDPRALITRYGTALWGFYGVRYRPAHPLTPPLSSPSVRVHPQGPAPQTAVVRHHS